MSQPPQPPAESVDDELVAYLDGELKGEAARRLEQRLAAEEPLRQRLRQLRKSWDLLDQLPRATVDDHFTRHTVETVVLSVAEDLRTQESTKPRRQRLRWAIAGTAVATAALAGFALVASIRAGPNEKLLRDLPVIENLELYRQAGDIDFLRKLHDEELFPEEASDAP